MRKLLVLGLSLGFAAAASADYLSSVAGEARDFSNVTPINGGGDLRVGTPVVIDISNTNSWDLVGDADNVVGLYDMAAALGLPAGSPVTMTGVAWDTNQTTVAAGSWLSDMRLYFDDNIAPDFTGLFLTPGAGSNAGGTAAFNSGGTLKLANYGIPDIVLPNGILRIDFHESFDDLANAIDGVYNSGSNLTIQVVPEPASLALLGLAGLLAFRRR